MSDTPTPIQACADCGGFMVIPCEVSVLGLDEPLPAVQCVECGAVFVAVPADTSILERIRQALRDQVNNA